VCGACQHRGEREGRGGRACLQLGGRQQHVESAGLAAGGGGCVAAIPRVVSALGLQARGAGAVCRGE
jgi:hypothetical protein